MKLWAAGNFEIIFLIFWKNNLVFVALWQREKVKNIVFRKRGVFSPYISYRYLYFTDTDIFTCKHINLSLRPVSKASLQFPMLIKAISPVWPGAFFSGEGDAAPPGCYMIHHQCTIKMPKRHVFLCKIERKTCW